MLLSLALTKKVNFEKHISYTVWCKVRFEVESRWVLGKPNSEFSEVERVLKMLNVFEKKIKEISTIFALENLQNQL